MALTGSIIWKGVTLEQAWLQMGRTATFVGSGWTTDVVLYASSQHFEGVGKETGLQHWQLSGYLEPGQTAEDAVHDLLLTTTDFQGMTRVADLPEPLPPDSDQWVEHKLPADPGHAYGVNYGMPEFDPEAQDSLNQAPGFGQQPEGI
jgi:hypothetical protein